MIGINIEVKIENSGALVQKILAQAAPKMAAAIQAAGQVLIAEHNKIIDDWKHKPAFRLTQSKHGGGEVTASLRVEGSNAKQWWWVNGRKGVGTVTMQNYRHTKKYPMRFKEKYKGKTFNTGYQPTKKTYRKGRRKPGQYGDEVRTHFVSHREIEPRQMDVVAFTRAKPRMIAAMRKVLNG